MKKIKIGVIFGGRSSEHDISLLSANNVIQALDPAKYEVIPIYIGREGQWFALSKPLPDKLVDQSTASLLPIPASGSLLPTVTGTTPAASAIAPLAELDVVFPVLHGPYGEDGTIQGLLELANIPFVGSGVLASATGMDKVIMKALFQQANLPLTPYQVVYRKQWQDQPAVVQQQCEIALPAYPWFVKPANLGSSVGISKVHHATEFADAMNEACRYDRKIIIEAAVIDAREIEVAILGNDELAASVAGEILPSREFYDYIAKYHDKQLVLKIPADIPDTVLATLQDYAKAAFKALDCAGMARVDFLVRRSDNAIFISELNTIPGFTNVSMYTMLWQASGINYQELLDRLIELALERHAERQQNLLAVPLISQKG